ncbi:MAG: branched-chain amino acid transport system II carrier protein, partial [Flavobacteriales bacterium]
STGSYQEKKSLIRRAGWLAGLALFLIYAGLILSGALMFDRFDPQITRVALLTGISTNTLGSTANLFLSLLVSLACFTTAVGIVTGTADFIKSRFKETQLAFTITAVIGCLLGVLMGQFDVAYIIAVALPALMFIYPITIVLILLNVVREKWATVFVFRAVIVMTIIFSIPDFMNSISLGNYMEKINPFIPLSDYSLGWVLPAFATFIIANLLEQNSPKTIGNQ